MKGSEICAMKKSKMKNPGYFYQHNHDVNQSPGTPRHSFDVLNYKLKLDIYHCYFSPYPKNFSASNIITFRVDSTLNSIYLHANNTSLTIDSIRLMSGTPLTFTHTSNILTITMNRTYNVNEIVDIKFAQPFFVDFGERLKKNVEFSEPTVRIVNSFVTGTSMAVELEFINPDKIDHTMTATIGCGYSFIAPNNRERKNNYAQSLVTRSVKAGSRLNQGATIPFTGGSTYIPNEPTVVDVTVN